MAGVKFLNGIDLTTQPARNMASPSAATDGANKGYVDNAIAGLAWKDEVRVATTTAGTLASSFESGDTIDGITLAANDRILIKDQADPTQNGIYTVASTGTPTRTTDADSATDLNNATVFVTDGTVNTGRVYTQTTKNPTVGASNIVFAQFASGITYTADGNGIELSGTVFALELDGTTLTKGSSGLRIGSGAAGAGLVESSGVLAVGAGTGITVAADTVAVDTSVVTRHASANIGNGVATVIGVTHNLGTKDVDVTVRTVATDENVQTDWVATSTTVVTLTFAAAPTTDQYRVTVNG